MDLVLFTVKTCHNAAAIPAITAVLGLQKGSKPSMNWLRYSDLSVY